MTAGPAQRGEIAGHESWRVAHVHLGTRGRQSYGNLLRRGGKNDGTQINAVSKRIIGCALTVGNRLWVSGEVPEIIDDRHGRASTIATSQLRVENWQAHIDDPTIADAVLDWLVHSAHRLELRGESVRKLRAARTARLDEAPRKPAPCQSLANNFFRAAVVPIFTIDQLCGTYS